MAAQKKPADAFTSFRILGKKAQNLLLKATKELKQRKNDSAKPLWKTDEMEDHALTIRFSLKNIAFCTLAIIAMLIAIWLMSVLSDKIILLLLAFFVAAVIDPGVRMLEKWGVPRGMGILAHYCVALLIFIFLLVSLIPIIATQLQQIAGLIKGTVNTFIEHPDIQLPLLSAEVNQSLTDLISGALKDQSIDDFTTYLGSLGADMKDIAEGATEVGLSLLDFVARMIAVLALAFFIQMEREQLRSWFRSFFATKQRAYIDGKMEAIQEKIGQWARGQLLLGLSIAILVEIALKIMRIPNAETLAVLAGFTEFIPYVGPIIAAVPAVLIAVTEGGFGWALIVMGVYYVIQWCENNLLVPLIMKRAVGLSPIAILFAIMAGLSFPHVINPILGVLLAVPMTTIITIFLNDIRRSPPSA